MSRASVEQAGDPPVTELVAEEARGETRSSEVAADEYAVIMHLERDQLVAETFRPVARAQLSRPVRLSLIALRILAVLLALMVIYTFIALLH
jgi:hypothetical protein